MIPALGLLWAASLALLGLLALTEGALPLPGGVLRWLGLCAIAGGQFVFMVLVADRVFVRTVRGVVLAFEALTLTVFMVGLVLLVAAVLATKHLMIGATV